MYDHYVNATPPLLDTADKSILEALKDQRIVAFERKKGTLYATECCDHYFTRRLSKEQVGSLIGELQAIHERM